MSITLKPKVAEILENYAEKKSIPKSAVIALAIEKYVREEESREGK